MRIKNFKTLPTIIITVFISLLLLICINSSVNAQSGGSAFLSPASSNYSLNQEFEVNIKADSNNERIRALQLIITYPYDETDPDLEPQSSTLTNTSSLLSYGAKTIEIDTVNNQVKILLSAYNYQGVIIPPNTTIATIPLKGLKATTKEISISKNTSDSYMHRLSDGYDILNPANIQDGSYTISQEDQSGGSVSLSPATATNIPIDQEFQPAILADSNQETIRAIQLIISFPYNQDVPIAEPTSTTLTNLTSLLTFSQKNIQIDPTNNLVKIFLSAYNYQGVIIPPETEIARIPLKAKNSGTINISFSKNTSDSYMHRLNDGYDILNPANIQDGSYTITSPSPPPSNSLAIAFNFDGITQNTGGKGEKFLKQIVFAKTGSTTSYFNKSAVWSDSQASYLVNLDNLSDLENGTYDIYLKGFYHLNTLFAAKTVTKGTTLVICR